MDYAEKRMAFGSPITKLQAIQVQARLGHLQAVLLLVESSYGHLYLALGTQCTSCCLG